MVFSAQQLNSRGAEVLETRHKSDLAADSEIETFFETARFYDDAGERLSLHMCHSFHPQLPPEEFF